ncbi:AMP-dependent synthetase and ligase, partial [mine drainage metagenome]
MAGYKYELTLGNLLKSSVQRNPNQEIVYSDKKRFTYSEFENRVERLSKALIHMGLKEDDNVAVIDWDS